MRRDVRVLIQMITPLQLSIKTHLVYSLDLFALLPSTPSVCARARVSLFGQEGYTRSALLSVKFVICCRPLLLQTICCDESSLQKKLNQYVKNISRFGSMLPHSHIRDMIIDSTLSNPLSTPLSYSQTTSVIPPNSYTVYSQQI